MTGKNSNNSVEQQAESKIADAYTVKITPTTNQPFSQFSQLGWGASGIIPITSTGTGLAWAQPPPAFISTFWTSAVDEEAESWERLEQTAREAQRIKVDNAFEKIKKAMKDGLL